jgi:radical SAM superfamily enzyme YgiQ (UPF0313 family)
MKVKMILPALTEAKSPFWRPIKYHLFPPLGLATIAGFFEESDEIDLQDEHTETLNLEDEPDLVVIQVYITSAYRAYDIADHYRRRGSYVVLGGLHVTSLPEEASQHADTIFLGPAEDTWSQFLIDFREGHPRKIYQSKVRSLVGMPKIRRDLIKRHLYLVPNSLVVSRGCPHHCDFCYKDAFYKGGKSFYTQQVDQALAQIESLSGKHLYFLDDHLFGHEAFASALFDGMRGMGRVWQCAATIPSILKPGLLEKAVTSGLRSLFIGFETLNPYNLQEQHKYHNLNRDYQQVIKRVHGAGVMINGSFVYGMDHDDETVFDRTVEWAVTQGIETATFHILTPYPGTVLYERLKKQGRLINDNWDLYDTRHVVYQPTNMTSSTLEAGYWQSYRNFYRWSAICEGAWTKEQWGDRLRHLVYTGAWKKCEPIWDFLIRFKQVNHLLPALESVLNGFNLGSNYNQFSEVKAFSR